MEFIAVSECKEGYVLAEDIVNKYGAILVVGNTVLNSYIINRLREMGINRIKVYHGGKNIGQNSNSRYRYVRENYEKSILGIRSIISELAAGKQLDAEKIIEISDMVCQGMYDSCNTLKILNSRKKLDEYTYTHSLNVAFYAMLIGKWLQLEDENIRILVNAGLLHDIGKTKIPAKILNKKSRLSQCEFDIIRKHTRYGYEIVKAAGCFPEEVCNAVLLHHERMDRSGYPYGLSGEQTSIYDRIIAVADVYDAMTSNRVYRKKVTPFEVFELFKVTGVKNFDPIVVNTFLLNLSACYVGAKVLLNTGEVGEIAFVPPHNITEPVIGIGHYYLDLARNKDTKILCMI